MNWTRIELSYQLFHDGGRYHIETSPLICGANQWTGVYMITASVMKDLSPQHCVSANSLFSTFVSPSGIWSESMSEAAVQRCSWEKVFRKYAANLQENTHAEKWNSIKLQSNFIEITLQHECSPANLLHIFRTSFFKNTSGRQLLQCAFRSLQARYVITN